MKILNKIVNGYKSMSNGKKTYAFLWLVTGIFLVVFIAIVSSLATKLGPTVPNKAGYYAYTETKKDDGSLPAYSAISVENKDDHTMHTFDSIYKTYVADSSKAPYELYDLKANSTTGNTWVDAAGKTQYYFTWSDKDGKNGWTTADGKNVFSTSSEESKNQNTIAGVGLGFAGALMLAVGATVLVSVKEGKIKRGGKK